MRKRIKAWRTVHGGSAALQLIPEAVDLRDEADVDDLTVSLTQMAAELAAGGEPPLGIVAIDTVAASMPGGNENDSADMSDVIVRVQRLGQRLNLLVLLVAHHGKDGEAGDRFAFRLAGVDLGEDSEGEPITSATPTYEPAPRARRTPKALNTAETLALKAVKLVADHGPHHPAPAAPGVPPTVVALARGDVKSRAMSCGFAAPEEKPNTISARFSRALQGLAAKGRVRIEGDWVWLL